jgi:carboxymethylenebutenolidase
MKARRYNGAYAISTLPHNTPPCSKDTMQPRANFTLSPTPPHVRRLPWPALPDLRAALEKRKEFPMTNLTPRQQTMLATWQQHTYAEFVLKDPDAALATMTENPYVLCIPSGMGGVGRSGVHEFYANHFLPSIPPDFELQSLSQSFSDDRMVEEFVTRFTHTLDMGWMLPGVPPNARKVEVALVGVVQFRAGKVAREHIYWDQATVLSQLGVLGHPAAAVGVGSAARLLKLSASSIGAEPFGAARA